MNQTKPLITTAVIVESCRPVRRNIIFLSQLENTVPQRHGNNHRSCTDLRKILRGLIINGGGDSWLDESQRQNMQGLEPMWSYKIGAYGLLFIVLQLTVRKSRRRRPIIIKFIVELF